MSLTSEILNSTLGDYSAFFTDCFNRLDHLGINVTGYPLSHLGLRTEMFAEYESFREHLIPLCKGYVENEHNGRPIAKLLLRDPLKLPSGFEVSLIELMPPKPDKHYPTALEHVGIVIGPSLPEFALKHQSMLTGQQDQSPICKPWYVTFPNGKRVKFYDIGLKEVVEAEGGIF